MYSALFPLPNRVLLGINLGLVDLGPIDLSTLGLSLLHLLLPLGIGLGLIALIGFFVAAELALVASSAPDIEALTREPGSHPNARLLLDAKHNLERYLSVTQTGTTAGSLLLGWLGESSLVRWLDPLMGRLSRWIWTLFHSTATGVGGSHWLGQVWMTTIGSHLPRWLSAHAAGASLGPIAAQTPFQSPIQLSAHAVAVALAFLLVTYVEIVLGELVPKVLAAQAPESTALLLIRPLHWFLYLFFPALAILDASVRTLVRPLGLRLGPDASIDLHPAIQHIAPLPTLPTNAPAHPEPAVDRLDDVTMPPTP